MRRQRFGLVRTWFCTAIVLMAFVSAALASPLQWLCEGRVCGVGQCCCEQIPHGSLCDRADPECREQSDSRDSDDAICGSGCGCTPRLAAAPDAAPSSSVESPAVPMLALPASPPAGVAAPLAITRFVLHPASPWRGPPPRTRFFLFPALRAPPCS